MSTEPVLRLLFSQDCSLLVGYQDEGIIRVIDVESGQLRYAQSVASSPYAVTFDPSGEALITVESTGGIAIRDAATGEIQRALKDPVEGTTSIDASPTAELLASSGVDGIIRLHHLATGEPLGSLVPTRPYAGMNIAGVTGITPAQRAALLTLGAVERC